jgi:hypothetical protein
MRGLILAVGIAALVGCGDTTGPAVDMSIGVDMTWWDCGVVMPGSDHPTGSCAPNQMCGVPGDRGWHCFCSAGAWSCQLVQSPMPDLIMANHD